MNGILNESRKQALATREDEAIELEFKKWQKETSGDDCISGAEDDKTIFYAGWCAARAYSEGKK